MTRVMQIMAGAVHGGAETFFERLAPALARAGVEQRIVIRRNADRAGLLRQQGLPPIELPFGGIFDFTTRRGIERATQAFAPDVQLAWMNRAARFCRPGRHIVVGRLGGYYDLKYFRHCQHLIGNTRAIRDYVVRSGWPETQAWYLPNFVDAATAPAADRTAYKTPADAPVILAVGRLHANKAFDVLIAALAEIPDAILWLAGDGPLADPLRRDAERHEVANRVRFLGWRKDIAALMTAADVFVCPSRHEPLGNVVIEAWAHHRPVVATASDGPSALIDHERTGLLVPVDNATTLAAAIRKVLDEPALAQALAEAGHDAFNAEFREEQVVAHYCEFFDRVSP
ncbi:MAG: glycosyltransferase [Alphaproteobacteria bacterium]|nr:glycosyltransferase [Alphaproteobacteria bacterium]